MPPFRLAKNFAHLAVKYALLMLPGNSGARLKLANDASRRKQQLMGPRVQPVYLHQMRGARRPICRSRSHSIFKFTSTILWATIAKQYVDLALRTHSQRSL